MYHDTYHDKEKIITHIDRKIPQICNLCHFIFENLNTHIILEATSDVGFVPDILFSSIHWYTIRAHIIITALISPLVIIKTNLERR